MYSIRLEMIDPFSQPIHHKKCPHFLNFNVDFLLHLISLASVPLKDTMVYIYNSQIFRMTHTRNIVKKGP